MGENADASAHIWGPDGLINTFSCVHLQRVCHSTTNKKSGYNIYTSATKQHYTYIYTGSCTVPKFNKCVSNYLYTTVYFSVQLHSWWKLVYKYNYYFCLDFFLRYFCLFSIKSFHVSLSRPMLGTHETIKYWRRYTVPYIATSSHNNYILHDADVKYMKYSISFYWVYTVDSE